MKITSTIYQNRKGAIMIMVRLPQVVAAKLAVLDAEAQGVLANAIAEAMNDRKGEGSANE